MLRFVKKFDRGSRKKRLPQWKALQKEEGSPGIVLNKTCCGPKDEGSIHFVLAELVLQSLTSDAKNFGGLGAVAASFLQGR